VAVLGGLCPDGWDHYNGNCYYVSTVKRWQPIARIRCGQMDAELVSISDQAEMDFVESIS